MYGTAGPGTTISASAAMPKTSRVAGSGTGSDPGDVGHQAAVVDEVGVPSREPASSSDGSWPRSTSRTGWAESGVTRYWYQEISQATVTTMSRLTPESGTIENVGAPRLFATPATVRRCALALKRLAASTTASSGSRQPAQDRLVCDRRLLGATASSEQACPAALPPAGVERNGRQRRAALTHPAVLDGDLRTERADVDILAVTGREPKSMLAHQERALANRAGARCGCTRHTHSGDRSKRIELSTARRSAICNSHMYRRRGWHGRGGRIERFQVAALLLLLRERPAHGTTCSSSCPRCSATSASTSATSTASSAASRSRAS